MKPRRMPIFFRTVAALKQIVPDDYRGDDCIFPLAIRTISRHIQLAVQAAGYSGDYGGLAPPGDAPGTHVPVQRPPGPSLPRRPGCRPGPRRRVAQALDRRPRRHSSATITENPPVTSAAPTHGDHAEGRSSVARVVGPPRRLGAHNIHYVN